MSKGTPNQTFRLLPSLKAECERTIERRNANSFESPWTFTEFIEIALREKIAKMERSRRHGRRDGKPDAQKQRLPQGTPVTVEELFGVQEENNLDVCNATA